MTNRLKIEENIFLANDTVADENRKLIEAASLFSINIIASPGAGKTTLIEKTIRELSPKHKIAVINGDIATRLDTERAEAAGASAALQINTGGECHLDAIMLNHAMRELKLDSYDLLIVENVGNLVCPASFKLGTHKTIVVASIPEGADKPKKYPNTYINADVLILNKIDLHPYVPFDTEFFKSSLFALNSEILYIETSCMTEVGLDKWFEWLEFQIITQRSK